MVDHQVEETDGLMVQSGLLKAHQVVQAAGNQAVQAVGIETTDADKMLQRSLPSIYRQKRQTNETKKKTNYLTNT